MSNLAGSSRVVSILTLGSRCTGLLRDAVFARSFGVGGAADIFFLAFDSCLDLEDRNVVLLQSFAIEVTRALII